MPVIQANQNGWLKLPTLRVLPVLVTLLLQSCVDTHTIVLCRRALLSSALGKKC